eukprot:8934021-Heterocapsa_arctica.AAC.1
MTCGGASNASKQATQHASVAPPPCVCGGRAFRTRLTCTFNHQMFQQHLGPIEVGLLRLAVVEA